MMTFARRSLPGLAWVLVQTTATGIAGAQEQKPVETTDERTALVEAMKAAHRNPAAPSEFHEKLRHFIGEWDVTVRVWMAGPAAPPSESAGTATIEWALGRRFAIEHLDAELRMGDTSVPLRSIGVSGYDNYRNQYVGTTFSNLSTEMIVTQGSVSPDGRTFTMYGTMHEPGLDVTGRMIRFVTRIEDENRHTVTVFDLHAGEDYKALEFAYRRR